MKTLDSFDSRTIRVVLTDIDGTLTDQGRLPNVSYEAMWKLHDAGYKIVPVTGRPAGWCEMIARLWPVHGVIGENGALYFSYDGNRMKRYFARGNSDRKKDRLKLREIRAEVLAKVPGCGIASDQFSRMFDLAVDFSEDVKPLSPAKIDQIVEVFKKHGATAKVSNIHVNGWFGDYDKVSTCKVYLKKEFSMTPVKMKTDCIFVGDSPNDEPMFEYFPHSFAVANIKDFLPRLKSQPAYLTEKEEGAGFAQVAARLLALK